MSKPEKIIVIDGSGYIFRAYFAIQRLTNSKGVATNAVFGFVNMLLKVLDVEKPTKLAIAFDTPKPTFRKEIYADYKANRTAPPEDLVAQIPQILEAVDCFGVYRVQAEGFEADDVIGTLAKRAREDGYTMEIITGDKDLMQLVTPEITLFDTMKDKRTDPAGVKEKFGVMPEQIIDFLALMGDSSDNIPGVTGIGEKTASDLISRFGSLEGIYEKLDEIKQPKRREILLNEKDVAFMSRELATVKCDLDLGFDWADLDYRGPKTEKLMEFLHRMEFQSLIKRLSTPKAETVAENGNDTDGADVLPPIPAEPVSASQLDRSGYVIIDDEEKLKAALQDLASCPAVALDTETTSLNIQQAKCVGISLCGRAGTGYYIPIGHCEPGEPEKLLPGQMNESRARELLRPFLENPKIPKLGQNLKYDLQILKLWGVEVRGVVADTLLESYLIDPDQSHNLDSLAQRYLGHQNISYSELTGKGKKKISFAEVPLAEAGAYSAEDADVTLRLHQKLHPQLVEMALGALYDEVEIPLIGVLAGMEADGITVDEVRLEKMAGELEAGIAQCQKQVYDSAGEEFNIGSPKQLSKILFEKLKLPSVKKTKTGLSTDESVLQQLSGDHEICQLILKYRELCKLKSTYVDGLLSQIDPRTGRVHTSYNQTVAATGRLSSSNPNLQNIPVGKGEYDIRSVFVAESGKLLLSADYSQVELRLLADMSEDPELLRAFRNDEDVHEYTGKLIFNVAEVSSDQRRIAKTINFGVVYGQTPFGLSQTLKIPPRDAKLFIDTYFARYAGVQSFLRQLADDAREKGYAVTRFGRRRPIAEISSQNRMRREMAERVAINMPLQGTAADMIKKAMVSIAARLKKENLESRMLLQVHDELVFEVPPAEKAKVEALVREEMEAAIPLKVPLKVDIGWGTNWRETD